MLTELICLFVCVCVLSDCPQVQCKEQYVAQQADEITLEPTEIVNVIRKTNEGEHDPLKYSHYPICKDLNTLNFDAANTFITMFYLETEITATSLV